MKLRLAILGGGRAAWAFGSAWRRIGAPISGMWLRRESKSGLPELLNAPRRSIYDLAHDSDLILVAVSDRAIAEVAVQVPTTDAIIFHPSGGMASVRGGFSLHPLRVLPPVGEPSDLEGALLVFEGMHRTIAASIAAAVGARFAEVDTPMKAAYHAAAVFGSNYVAAVLDISEQLMRRAGVTESRTDIAALAQSAIENWLAHTDARRFTGPAARGDRPTIAAHLGALADDTQVMEIYALLARSILAASE